MAEGYYYVTFGKGDSSDYMDWEIELDDDEQKIFYDCVARGEDPNDIPELQNALDAARDEIESIELNTMIENEDEYTMECMGLYPVDADEINTLVAQRDAHTLSFFGLEDLPEEELDAWDANELDELPNVADFDVDFVAESPFENGWDLTVCFSEPEYEENEDEEDEDELELDDQDSIEWDDYCGYPFAMEVVNGQIISMTSQFRKKVRKAIREKLGLTDKKISTWCLAITVRARQSYYLLFGGFYMDLISAN